MSQSLRRGLELLATMDSDHTDAGNGVVKDFSGAERHLLASGGPTYGQDSPVGEAVGFDGVDDRLDTADAASIDGATEWTIAHVCRWDGGNSGSGKYVQMHGSFSIFTNHDATDTYKTQFSTPGGSVTVKDSGFDRENEWVAYVATFDAGVANLTINGETADVATTSDSQIQSSAPNELTVGQTTSGTVPYPGDIAVTAEWSRALSDAEIDQFTRMTDRMVSKL